VIHDRILERALHTPDAIAVDGLTFVELRRRSGALARRLREMGIGPEVAVGVCSRRSPVVVTAFLAILRAGGVYVPLDLGYPPERLELMVRDAGVRVILGDGTRDAGVPVLELSPDLFEGDELETTGVLPENLAYIMYTSGSTGVPKGVMITHAAIANTIAWMQDAYPLRESDVVAHKTSISFTDSIWELLWPPLAGARLVVIDENDTRFPRLLLQRLREHHVAVTQFVPAQMRLFLDEVNRAGDPDPLPDLRLIFNGGEALPASLARDWFRAFPGTRIANAYGMTESAIYGTNFVVEPADAEPTVLIGRAITNERTYVLDPSDKRCPPNVIGEIHLAGESLARGYHRRPDLTAQSFVPDPYGPPGTRMYRTGDLGRQLPSGDIDCLGRLDRQIKVHGGRAELGEVEAALAQHPEVRQAVVVARRVGADHQLAAFYTYRRGDPGARELYRFLAAKLPSFMIPALLVPMENLPLTVNGKVDRPRLLERTVVQN
jgi:amino acid adenylation domain-containing protein